MGKILVWSLLLFTEILAHLDVGERCGADNKGICAIVDACPTAIDEIRKTRNHSLLRCGFEKDKEIVCCMDIISKFTVEPTPTSDKPTSTPGKPRKSIEACKAFGKSIGVKPLIINGERAELGDFPHMAALGFNNSNDLTDITWAKCGGSLISKRYVLTAAHCMVSQEKSFPVLVRLGKIDIVGNDDNAVAQDIEVDANIMHPDYSHFDRLNDIALIRLSRAAEFTKNVHPICLFTEPEPPKGLLVSGWGVTNTTTRNTSRYLLFAAVAFLDLNRCNETFQKIKDSKPLFTTHLCAVSIGAKPADTCQGDSGGPIQTGNLKNDFGTQFNIVGVTSYGRGCGSTQPSIYTRVYSYLNWIEGVVWKDGVFD